MNLILSFLIFPGFLFTAVMGLLVSWIDRKITARIQWRKGPVWYQDFIDFIKLLGKETITPSGASKLAFFISPLLALVSVTLISLLVGRAIINPQRGFLGDLIGIFSLSIIPAIATIVGGKASGNSLVSISTSYKIKFILSYELPFILCCFIPIIKSGGLIKIGEIINHQMGYRPIVDSFSGAIAFISATICLQAKLEFIPFDIFKTEQRIIPTLYTEYSGLLLAVFRLVHSMLLFILPIFLITIFWMPNLGIQRLVLKYVLLLIIIILIKNTNPRIKAKQAIKFFLGPITLSAVVAIVLAILGK